MIPKKFNRLLMWALAAVAVLGIFLHHSHATTMAIAAGALTDEEFQKKVFDATDALVSENKRLGKEHSELKSSYEKVTADLDRADKEVKKSLEELTKVKNECNGLDSEMKALKRSMEKTERLIRANARSSFRDPMQAMLTNESTAAYFKALGMLIRHKGDESKLPAELRKIMEDARAEHKAMSGVDASLGQATIPTTTFNEIYDTLLEYGQWSTLGVMNVGARTTVLPVATARPNFYWIGGQTGGSGETTAITESDMAGSSVTLQIQTLAVYLTIARELLADSTVDLAPYLMKQMMQSISFGLDTASFIATGATDQTNAGYYGIFNAGSVNTNLAAVAAAGNTTVAQTQLEDWTLALLTVNPEVLLRKPRWWIHPQNLVKAALVRDKNGRPIFQTWLEVPNPGSIGSILGYPVIQTAVAPSTDGASQTVAAFGDGDGQAVGIRQDMEFATSDDILFAQNMRAFRALMRAGVKLKSAAASQTLKPISVLTLAAA